MNRLLIAFMLATGFLLNYSAFIVGEGSRAIVLRFGGGRRDLQQKVRIYPPGIYFKVPIIDKLQKMDSRIQTIDSRTDRFFTAEKKDLLVDSYVKWRVVDFGRYYSSTGGDASYAKEHLKRKISDRLRSEIGNRTIKDIVSGSRGELMEDARNLLNNGPNSTIEQMGIQVVDVRIKKINLPDEVSSSIYQRMCAERKVVAEEHRSQGREQAEVLRAEVDRRVVVILSEAGRKARSLRGEGDAKAAQLFAEAFGRHPEFYMLVRSLKAYGSSFGPDDLLIVRPDSHFFRYLASPSGQK